jgi:hypothetical protein
MRQRHARAEGSLVHRGAADVKLGHRVFSLTPPRRVGESCATVGDDRMGGLAGAEVGGVWNTAGDAAGQEAGDANVRQEHGGLIIARGEG